MPKDAQTITQNGHGPGRDGGAASHASGDRRRGVAIGAYGYVASRSPRPWDAGLSVDPAARGVGRAAPHPDRGEPYTAAAIRAYRHYLALRSDPEPALRPQVGRVRAELQRHEAGDPR